MRLATYLRGSVDELAAVVVGTGVQAVRHEEDEPRRAITYEWEALDLAVRCGAADRIECIFAAPRAASLFPELPFSLSRGEIRARFGDPEATGGPCTLPGLGRKGPWERFAFPMYHLHVEFSPDVDEICLVTVMTAEVVPRP